MLKLSISCYIPNFEKVKGYMYFLMNTVSGCTKGDLKKAQSLKDE